MPEQPPAHRPDSRPGQGRTVPDQLWALFFVDVDDDYGGRFFVPTNGGEQCEGYLCYATETEAMVAAKYEMNQTASAIKVVRIK